VRVPFTTELAEHLTQLKREHIVFVSSLCCLCALCGLSTAACGRKGPPLPPLVRLPVMVGNYTAKRLGDTVVLQFTIPIANTDNSRPADLDRVEVYAHTGPLPTPADFLRYGTLVGNIAVKSAVGAAPREALPGLDQGAKASFSETITAAQMEIGQMPIVRNARALSLLPAVGPDLETPGTVNLPPPPMRYYVTVGVSRRNRRGAFSAPLGVPLVSPPDMPGGLNSQYTQEAISLAWAPTPPVDDAYASAVTYNVYEAEDPGATSATGGTTPPKPPVNPGPLTAPAFTDARIEFGVRKCYVVRSVRIVWSTSMESAASPPVCLTPVDTFPPAAPRSLVAVSSENVVSLIWEPNTDKDLAGYLVLRGEAPGEKLTPLTPAPVKETTYRDTTVKPGVSYVYVVVAVDTATPPNQSEYSNRATAEGR
jgi:hypothetical protein